MKKIKVDNKLCLICMEEEDVDIVEVTDTEIYKGQEISFKAVYEYCKNADEYLETEELIKINCLSMKNEYRKKLGLLTSIEIIDIREKYMVSQKDLSEILDWEKTSIASYENNQVQDRVQDDVLRKIGSDPKSFLDLLERAKDRIGKKAYNKYYCQARELCNKQKNK